MVSKKNTPQLESVNLSHTDIKNAIPKIMRRIKELEEFDFNSLNERADPRIEALEKKIDDTLVNIFGKNTIEYQRYSIPSLDHAPHIMGGIPLSEAIDGIKFGFNYAIVNLNSIIETFEERLEEEGDTPRGIADRTFKLISLHNELENACWKLFQDGHYANAIENGCKVLETFVKLRSGMYDLHGTELMQKVFSPNNPILKFNELQNESDFSEQQGMMFLYSGVILALRNPRAHGIVEDNPDTAIELLGFINFLMKSIDKCSKYT